MFTVFPASFEDLRLLPCDSWPDCTFCVYQLELSPETSRLHFQGYLELGRTMRYTALQEWPGLADAHFEKRRGSQQQAVAYCTKPNETFPNDTSKVDGPWFYGKPKRQGQRSDLDALYQRLSEGATLKEVSNEFFELFLRYGSRIQSYITLNTPARDFPPHVTVLTGPPRSGKSKYCHSMAPNAFWRPPGIHTWWDTYDRHEDIILDDFYGGQMPYSYMLRLLDRYPVLVQTKGGWVQFRPRRIFITSNAAPEDWYDYGRFPTLTWEASALRARILEFGIFISTGEVHRRPPPRLNDLGDGFSGPLQTE